MHRFASAAAMLCVSGWAHAAEGAAQSLFTVLVTLALILGGFVALAFLARRYLPGMSQAGAVKVVGTTSVGPRERVVLVEVDGTWLVLGVGGGNVRLLHSQPKPATEGTQA